MENFLWRNKNMYKVTPDVFLDALVKVFNLDEVGRIKLYWYDVSPSDESVINSELELQQVTYLHENNKVEQLLFDNDQCYTVERDKENQKFFDSIAKHIFDENACNMFSSVYVQHKSQMEDPEGDRGRNSSHDLITCKAISGHLLLM